MDLLCREMRAAEAAPNIYTIRLSKSKYDKSHMQSNPALPKRKTASGIVPHAAPATKDRPALDLQARAQEAASFLRALANADRLVLLCQMVGAERNVTELGELTGIGQPSLSQQLGVLRGEQLACTRREGKHVLYRMDSPAALAVLQTLYGLFCEPARPPARPRPAAALKRSRKVLA